MATENVHVEKVKKILEEIRALGAEVKLEKRPSREELAGHEEAIGFRLPGEYRVFVLELGGIEIELVRTWFFYGIASSVPVTKFYAEEVESFRAGGNEDGPYYPKRFVVLMDEGDYSNAAEGWVYDADLTALFPMDGGR